jgi:UDP-glucose 4-epimerase
VKEPKYDADINLIGGRDLIESCRDAGVKHIVFASAAAVYGKLGSSAAVEDLPKMPGSPYGISKATFEDYLRFAQDAYGIKSASLRFANVYGPRQTVHGEAGVVAIFLSKLLDGKSVVINGSGRQTRDFVYVGDVARMVAIAASRSLSGVFNVSTGKETSVNALYRFICGTAGIARKANHGPAKAGDEKKVCLDPSKAKSRAGWKASVDVEEGIRHTFDWWRAQRA